MRLDGDWIFYPNLFLTPDDEAAHTSDKGFMHLPGLWNGLEFDGTTMGSKGFGTFQVTIINTGTPRDIELFFPIAPIEAYRVFTNNIPAFSVGTPGKSAGATIPEYRPHLLKNHLEDQLTLTIQVASFTYQEGGYYKPIMLGRAEALSKVRLINHSKDVFLLGVTILLFFLFMLLSKKDPKDNYVLNSLACMIAFSTLYIASIGEMLVVQIFPATPFKLYYFMYYVISIAGGTLYLHIINGIFPHKISQKIRIASIIKSMLLFICIIFFDKYFIGVIATTKDALLLLEFFYGIFILSGLVSQKAEGAAFIWFGSTMVMACIGFDILYVYGITFSVHEQFASIGLVFLVFCFTVVAAKKYERTLEQSKQLTVKLKKANTIKDRFLANTSHELRTPINSILALLKTLRSEGGRKTEDIESMDMVVAGATRLKRIIHDLLDYSSLKEGRIRLQGDNFDLANTLSHTLKEMKPLFDEKNIHLSLEIQDKAHLVHGDEYRLVQVLYNVLGNAVKFTEHNGEITVQIKEESGTVHIDVADTGIGIAPDKLTRIFDSFEQGGEDVSLEYGGLGIGLSLSRDIMLRHGGDISVRSRFGEGTTFTISMPAGAGQPIGTNPEQATDIQKPHLVRHKETRLDIPGSTDETVIIIDDDYSNIFAAASVLKSEGLHLKGFTDGAEGLEKAVTDPNAVLVIVDLMMPALSGDELIRRLRKRRNLLELPVVVLTAKSQLDALVDCFEAGANDFLFKPFENEELKARVRTLSQLRKMNETSIENEAKMLQAQIRPHFLHNALNVIVDSCYEDGEKAADMLIALSDHMRRRFVFSHNKQVPIQQELELVQGYLDIEKSRFEERINYEIDVDGTSEVSIIPFAIQTLVENSALHGLRNKVEGGSITIKGYPVEAGYMIEVADTGIGIPEKDIPLILSGEKFSGNGIGLANLRKRLMQTYDADLDIESVQGRGTTVRFEIPNSSFNQ